VTRLILVTPPAADIASFPRTLAVALDAGDIAAVILAAESEDEAGQLAGAIVPMIQQHGSVALVRNLIRVASSVNADGVHVDTGIADIRSAVHSLRPRRIVGAGGLHSRHLAMEAGEAGVDYVFFGRLHGDTQSAPHPRSVDLVAWWAELMEIPAVIMAGASLDSLDAALATGADFVALHRAVWEHEAGPDDAVRTAVNRIRNSGAPT
jgi:thiamine-phosphate pyrophosphorylase